MWTVTDTKSSVSEVREDVTQNTGRDKSLFSLFVVFAISLLCCSAVYCYTNPFWQVLKLELQQVD